MIKLRRLKSNNLLIHNVNFDILDNIEIDTTHIDDQIMMSHYNKKFVNKPYSDELNKVTRTLEDIFGDIDVLCTFCTEEYLELIWS